MSHVIRIQLTHAEYSDFLCHVVVRNKIIQVDKFGYENEKLSSYAWALEDW